jgi:hypothetical protein
MLIFICVLLFLGKTNFVSLLWIVGGRIGVRLVSCFGPTYFMNRIEPYVNRK